MEEILNNPGLNRIINQVSHHLDVKSLAQCRLVCQSWRDLIDHGRRWLQYQSVHIHRQEKIFVDTLKEGKPKVKATIKERFPEWVAFMNQYPPFNLNGLKRMNWSMWRYFKNDKVSLYSNPLTTAVAKSDINFVQFLIDCDIDLNMKDPKGFTPMHHACRYGNIQMPKLLIKHLSNYDATENSEDLLRIFNSAISNSDPQVLKLILDTFRFENIRDKNGWTMIHHAVFYGPEDQIQFLLESRQKIGFDLEAISDLGNTVLHLACLKRDIGIVDLIFNALQDINSEIGFDTQNIDQSTPLHYACKTPSSDVAIKLLERFPEKVHVLGFQGNRVLHYACQSGHVKLLKYILDNANLSANFMVKNLFGRTPLDLACGNGQVDVVKFFLANYTRLGICVLYYIRARKLAKQLGHLNVVNMLGPWKLFKSMMTSLFNKK